MSEMRKLFDKYECDKGWKHEYEKVYEPDFEALKEQPINILDIGIWKGASMEAWLDYFPNATVYGIDIFTRVTPEEVPALSKDRTKWLQGDSTSPKIVREIKKAWGDVKFDIIIDDGKHTPEANQLTFRHIFPFLKEDGRYYIEDIWPFDIMTQKELQDPWLKANPDEYNLFKYMQFLNEIFPYKIKHFDGRYKRRSQTHVGEYLDSYIIRVNR